MLFLFVYNIRKRILSIVIATRVAVIPVPSRKTFCRKGYSWEALKRIMFVRMKNMLKPKGRKM